MINRHFVNVDGRNVHYRRSGQGPALVLLHASPVSSKVFEPMMRFHSQSYTTFAFDTPGNGLSDPLTLDDPNMADYASAQIKTLKQIGIARAIVYGRHTGASIAASMAEQDPDLVTLAMTDGYPVFSEAQRKSYLSGYLNDLPVEADGTHLTWLWHRYRDQFIFWPWNKKEADAQADCDMPSLEFIHNGVIALMEAGNNYKAPYRAVFKHDALATLEKAGAPVCAAARPGDSLYRRFADIPDKFWKEQIPRDFVEATMRERELMAPYRPDCPAPGVHETRSANATRRGFVSDGSDQLHYIEYQDDDAPIVAITSAPGSLDPIQPVLTSLAKDRHVLAIEPAGCGDSDAPSDGDTSLDRQADRVIECLQRLGIENADFVGWGAGGAIALEVARRCQTGHVVLCDPLLVEEPLRASYARAFSACASPQMDGSHLARLWREVRDGELYFPWFDTRREAMRDRAAIKLDPERLTRKTLFLAKHAKSHQSLWHSAWAYPWASRIANYDRSMSILRPSTCMIPKDLFLNIHGKPQLTCDAAPQAIAAAILSAFKDVT